MIRPIDVIGLPDARLYPLYYFLVQPMTVWMVVPLIVIVVMLSPKSFYRMLAVLVSAFLIEFLPSFIMVNPWLPDQYPYLAEAYWIYLHGRIFSVHYLSTVPGLGLSYGILEIVTDLSPFIISKAFSFIQAIALVVMLAPLSKKLTGNEALLPLLFLSLNYFIQINIFHRATLHFTYMLILLYLVFTALNSQHLEWRCTLASAIVFSSMVLTYPGSGFILTTIIGAYLLLYIVRKTSSASLKLPVIVFSIIFGAWYGYVAWSELRIVGSIWSSLAEVLQLKLSFEESMTTSSTSLTPLFRTLIYVRLIIEVGVIATGFLTALHKYVLAIISHFRGRGNNGISFAYVLTLASLIAPAPWLLTEWSRWSFYKFGHFFLLFSLMSFSHYVYSQHHLRKFANFLPIKMLSIVAMISALLLVPLLRYTSVPYLNVTTPELYSVFFVHEHFTFNSNYYYLEYPPYVRVLVRGDDLREISSMYWFENVTLGLYAVTNRALTRDGFYLYPVPLQVRLEELENSMFTQGAKVYDNEYNRIYYLK
jgi:hypothetical protein